MNNYRQKAAVELAKAICNIMNGFGIDDSVAFRQELLSAIQDIRFNGREWSVI